MQNIEQKRKQAMEGREPVISQLGWAGKEIEQLKSRIGRLEKAREECGTDVTTLEAKREALRAELGTQMTGGLSAEEEEQLESLGRQVEELQKSLSEKATERGTVRPSCEVRLAL
jgi:structural maintenance of chromosome 3 (chondroitin sulfate proteoglycan 6)